MVIDVPAQAGHHVLRYARVVAAVCAAPGFEVFDPRLRRLQFRPRLDELLAGVGGDRAGDLEFRAERIQRVGWNDGGLVGGAHCPLQDSAVR